VVKIVGTGPGYNDEVEIEATNETAEFASRDFLAAWRELYKLAIQPTIHATIAAHFAARPATEGGSGPRDPGGPPAELSDPDRAPQAPPEAPV
jgi:hypothetical protein